MKKILSLALASIMILSFASCAANKPAESAPLHEAVLNGFESSLYLEQNAMAEFKDIYSPLSYESVADAILAVTSGKCDSFIVPTMCADYILANNPKLEAYTIESNYFFQMGVLKEQEELRDLLNSGIETLKENGELDALIKKYVDGDIVSIEPEKEGIPVISGAKTIKVAVTGDYAPIEYVDAGGNSAGFNIALLKALSKQLNVNIELVNMAASARLTALSSGKVDVLFYVLTNPENDITDILDKNNMLLTSVYYESKGCQVIFRKGERENIMALNKKVEEALVSVQKRK